MLEAGMKAPEFVLNDQNGNEVRLSDFLGKKVVLYFYPRDNTPGCTRQACAFAGAYQGFKDANVAVIGVSKDSVASHVKFAQKIGKRNGIAILIRKGKGRGLIANVQHICSLL